jgi:tryptophanyl-tRNA synthetase
MTDDADAIRRKIQKATTDPHPLPETPAGLQGRPEAANLLGIYAALADESLEQTCARFAGSLFSTFKRELADLAVAKLGPITEEMRRLESDPGAIDAILAEGATRARAITRPIMREVYDAVGFLTPTPPVA